MGPRYQYKKLTAPAPIARIARLTVSSFSPYVAT